MTPADRAMRNALYEAVQEARSPTKMIPAGHPLHETEPQFNLTSFDPRGVHMSKTTSQSLNRPSTPHVTLHQFRKFQQSPALSSSPDFDYKRVRRKQSTSNLSGRPRGLDNWPLPDTSSPLLLSTSPQSFSSSLPPPLPLTPRFLPSPTSPSLSSTVDTLPSTPPRTPIQRGESSVGQWRNLQRVEPEEAIRTKRKFQHLRVAKRLPHYTAHQSEFEGVWEVHAAVLDVGAFEADVVGERDGIHMTAPLSNPPHSASKVGRSVRFEDESARKAPQGVETKSASDADQSATSSYSLSKFKFPAPPGHNWAGTFGHLDEATPPTTPTTLHYRGASFDVVNPHASLLLGNSDFETPAEIDGLLDDYFNRSAHSIIMPYDDVSGQKSASQYSLQTTSSNGRSAKMYPDPESARRGIMNLATAGSQQTIVLHPSDDSSTLSYNNEDQLEQSQTSNRGRIAGVLDFHPNVEEAAASDPDPINPSRYRPTARDEGFQSPYFHAQPRGEGDSMAQTARAVDRASSVYPQSLRSDQFDLTVSEAGDDNIDGIIGAGRGSYYAGDVDDADQAVNEDDDDAQAIQNTRDEEDTLGKVYDQYHTGPSQEGGSGITSDQDATGSSRDPEVARHLKRIATYSKLRHAPTTRPPTPSFTALGNPHPLHYPSSQSEQPTSDRTYGNTGPLLGLTPEGEHRRYNLLHDTAEFSTHHHDPNEAVEEHDRGDHGSLRSAGYHFGVSTERSPTLRPSFSDVRRRQTHAEAPQLPDAQSSRRGFDDNDDGESGWFTEHGHSESSLPRRSSESQANISDDGNTELLSIPVPPANPHSTSTGRWPSMGRDGNSSGRLPDRFDYPSHTMIIGHEVTGHNVMQGDALGLVQREVSEMSAQGNSLSDTMQRSRSSRRRDHEAFEFLRRNNPNALAAAIDQVDLPRPPQSAFSPDRESRSFLRAMIDTVGKVVGKAKKKLSPYKTADEVLSDTQSLLNEQRRIQIDAIGATRPSPRTPRSGDLGTPSATPIAVPESALLRGRPTPPSARGPPLTPTPAPRPTENIELQPVNRDNGPSRRRAAMSSQRGLRHTILFDSIATTPTGRLTDAQLAEAEPGWTNRPNSSADRPTHAITSFAITQSDGSVEQVNLLMNAEEGRHMGNHRRQMQLTQPYFQACRVFPLTAALFGLGAFDFKMKSMTDGVIDEMAPAAKKEALIVYVPLGLIGYVAIGLMIALIVVALSK